MSQYIQLYQIQDGVALQNRVTTIENFLENGDFEVNEVNGMNGVIQNNLMVGYTDNTDLCSNLTMEVLGKTLFHDQVQIIGNTIFGKETDNAEDVSNNDTNLYVYGDLRIMDGGNIIIEDVSNTTVTELRTEVKITDSIDISNDGTNVAMIVNQLHTATEDIVQFRDNGVNVFTIGANGKTFIKGDVSVNSILDISGIVTTQNNFVLLTKSTEKMIVDVSGNIQMINSDPSYSALDISATSALKIPIGTSEERPSDLKAGQIRYNTTNSQFEGYNTTNSWQGLGGVIDIDQDTKIIAETNPLDDNDEIQIFTAGDERMKVDASGNIQMMNSNPDYSALDISGTSSLAIPRGTIDERPATNSSAPRSLRFNSDTSLCEVYTESNIWSGIPVYKAEQPPALLDISQVRLSETVTVNWEKFPDIYKDVFDGKCYPIYLQTFVDISFTDINSTSSNGWKTIIIGAVIMMNWVTVQHLTQVLYLTA